MAVGGTYYTAATGESFRARRTPIPHADRMDASPTPAAPTEPRHRVLLVDDQPLVGKAVSEMLAGHDDITFRYCRDADRAIEEAAAFRPTVILQDLVMPGIDGLEMVRRFRESAETGMVPVVVLSAREDPAVKASLLGSGAGDYLVKLPDPVELVARIRLHSEGHARLLERNAAFAALESSNAELAREREKSERLLHMILPARIAERLKAGAGTIADLHPAVTVLFADICGFTEFSAQVGPREVVEQLDAIFGGFDRIAARHGVEKIKTIGDAWMAVAGLSPPRADHAEVMADMAIELGAAFEEIARERHLPIQLRIGMHSGPVVAGVIGHERFSYDLWGDSVNMASRMESHGEPGRIHVSEEARKLLEDRFDFDDRGTVAIKGKGSVRTAFLRGRVKKGTT